MCSRLRLLVLLALLAGATPPPLGAQDLVRLRARADSLAIAWRRANALADALDSLALRSPVARDTIRAGALWIVADSSSLPGRVASCENAVLAGSRDRVEDSLPRIVTITPWWWRAERLLVEDRFLADVVREVGHERFLRFWNSPLGVEPSLAAALRAPVGEWTERWQRRFAPRLPLGPTLPLSAGLTGLVLVGAAVLSALLAAARRQAH